MRCCRLSCCEWDGWRFPVYSLTSRQGRGRSFSIDIFDTTMGLQQQKTLYSLPWLCPAQEGITSGHLMTSFMKRVLLSCMSYHVGESVKPNDLY